MPRMTPAIALTACMSAEGGEVRPGTKTATFIEAVEVPVHVPLSGRTMEFDGKASCVAGC